MNAIIVLVAATALGIEYGWEPLPGGGHEYTLQIEPPLLKVLESGQEEIFSDVPEGVNVRRYRIVVGVGKLRRDYGPLEAEIERPPTTALPGQPPAGTAIPSGSGFNPSSELSGPPDQFRTPEPEGMAETELATDLEVMQPAREATAPNFALPADESAAPGATSGEAGRVTLSPESSTSPADNGWHDSKEQPISEGKAEQITIDTPEVGQIAQAPAKLPESANPSGPITSATFEDGKTVGAPATVNTGKPEIPESELPGRPWTPLVVTIVLLACSLGGNIFLGWIAADARARYRSAVAKLRGASA
jgi:hypothetical protein